MSELADFIRSHGITEIECVVPDISGIARGKIVPAQKLLRILDNRGLRLPEDVFIQTVTGDAPDDDDLTAPTNGDVFLVPDESTVRLVPWYKEPTAVVICDAVYEDERPVDLASRHVLQRVLKFYDEKGWQPIVAPELEFYLVKTNTDPDYPLEPPLGRSGRQESGRQAFGIDAVNEFDPITEDIYDFCEIMQIDIDILTHESGAAQIELNFNHGAAINLADQVFLFKRAVREAAYRHGMYATFMAKPMQHEPGSAMHLHQSIIDTASGKNIFGADDSVFMNHIAGLQKYLGSAIPLLAPNVNSYRRLALGPGWVAPINTHWGMDNRTCGLRVPTSDSQNRRIEMRIAGADANPYLAMAASLACGFIGMQDGLEPSNPIKGSAHALAHSLPRHQFDAVRKLSMSKPLQQMFGERFVEALIAVKNAEYEAYNQVISSWERQNLLLNV